MAREAKLTSLRIPTDLLRRAERLAVFQHRSRSSVLLQAIDAGLRREEKKPQPELPVVAEGGGALD